MISTLLVLAFLVRRPAVRDPYVAAAYQLLAPRRLSMLQVVRGVVELGDVGQLYGVQAPHYIGFPLGELNTALVSTSKDLKLFDAMILCWPFIIMNFPAFISSQDLGFSRRSLESLSIGIRQTFCRIFSSPNCTSLALTFLTISDYSFRMTYSSLAGTHWAMST